MTKKIMTTEEAMKILNSEPRNHKMKIMEETIENLNSEPQNSKPRTSKEVLAQLNELGKERKRKSAIEAEKLAQKKAEELAIAEVEKKAQEARNLDIAKEKKMLWEQKIAKKDQEILDNQNPEMQTAYYELITTEKPKNEGLSAFEAVLSIGLDVTELWYDQDGKAGITVSVNGHYEHYFVASDSFKDIIYSQSFKVNNTGLRKSTYNEILENISSICKYHGKLSTSHLRIAENNGKTYIDLVNDKWEAIEVDEFGWRIVNPKNVKFIRTKNMRSQCTPEKGGSIEELKKFINLEKNEDFILLVGFILKCLDPHSPYPILAFIGQQGSGKSETSQMIISLVAPSHVPMLPMPSSERDFLIAAKNNHIFAIDNVSNISKNQSDWICRLATNSGFTTRKLFTDSEESTMFLSRPLVLNGINDIVNRPDLIDRTLVINLPQISEEIRCTKQLLWKEFNDNKPRILGAFCDGLSSAMRYLSLVELTKNPRMMDFAQFVTAAEVAFKWEYETFLSAYLENIEDIYRILKNYKLSIFFSGARGRT